MGMGRKTLLIALLIVPMIASAFPAACAAGRQCALNHPVRHAAPSNTPWLPPTYQSPRGLQQRVVIPPPPEIAAPPHHHRAAADGGPPDRAGAAEFAVGGARAAAAPKPTRIVPRVARIRPASMAPPVGDRNAYVGGCVNQ
ncbi:MAG: hypothetical protein WDN48_14010 [Pseudolabrys sp.]